MRNKLQIQETFSLVDKDGDGTKHNKEAQGTGRRGTDPTTPGGCSSGQLRGKAAGVSAGPPRHRRPGRILHASLPPPLIRATVSCPGDSLGVQDGTGQRGRGQKDEAEDSGAVLADPLRHRIG